MPSKTVIIVNSKLPEGANTAEVFERAAKVFVDQDNGWKIAPKADQPKAADTPKS